MTYQNRAEGEGEADQQFLAKISNNIRTLVKKVSTLQERPTETH